jgi:alpha-L-fucosidase 2
MYRIALLLLAASAAFALDKSDIEYSRPDGKPLLLDMHVPDGPGTFPVGIVVHGGGFDEGTKKSHVSAVLDVLAKANFAWISIDYRMAPAYHFPQPAEDVDNAIRWVKKHGAEYRIDTSKIALIGESAGAFLTTYAATHDTPETRVAAHVDFYGPVDYAFNTLIKRDHPERFDIASANVHQQRGGGTRYFGVEKLDDAGIARLREVSPANAVHKGMAPFLIFHGTQDNQVAYEQSPAFCDAIVKAGSKCDLIPIEGGGHGMSNWEKSEAQQKQWKPQIIAWLKKTMEVK